MQKQKQQCVAEYENYKRLKLLGEGAFGKAYLVNYLKDNTKWVIKQMELKAMSEEEKRETLKEAKILEAFDHPNIVKFKEVYKTKKGKLCIVMEYADGGDLAKITKEQRGKYFTENQIIDWFVQICLAMKHVHDRKIIHRDLKGQNIFLTKNNMIKLGDFGIARVLGKTMEKAKTMVGTPYYLSPEIIEQKAYSFKTDIWSLGVILYELCALKPPFNADSLHFLALKIVKGSYSPVPSMYSRDLKNLIGSLLQVNPLKRPTIQQVLKTPFLTQRIQQFLTESQRKNEFSHTVLHNQRIIASVHISDFKQVNQEVPCPAHLLELSTNQPQQIAQKEKAQEKVQPANNAQQQQGQNQQLSNSKVNYHYKQAAWQIQKEQEKRDKEKLREKEIQRVKEIEQQRQKDVLKRKELERQKIIMQQQAEAARNRQKDYENQIQARMRQLEELNYQKEIEYKQKMQKQSDDKEKLKQQQFAKYQQASREQFFLDKQQAALNKQRALQMEGIPQKQVSGESEQQPEVIYNNKKSEGSALKSPEKKKQPVSSYNQRKKEQDEKLKKMQQQKIEKIKEKQEKRQQEMEQKRMEESEEKQKLKEEKVRQREQQREKMREDKKRAKWGKNNFEVEFITHSESGQSEQAPVTETTQDTIQPNQKDNQEEQQKPNVQNKKAPAKKPSKWNKNANQKKIDPNDVPVEIFVSKKPSKKEEGNSAAISDEQKQEQLSKENKQNENGEEEKEENNENDDNNKGNQQIQVRDNYDDLDDSDADNDDSDYLSDSFAGNDDREMDQDQDDEDDIPSELNECEMNKKNGQILQELASEQQESEIPVREQEQMQEMFLEMMQLVNGVQQKVDKLPSNGVENENIFDLTYNMPNLKEKDDKRKKDANQEQKLQPKQKEQEKEEMKSNDNNNNNNDKDSEQEETKKQNGKEGEEKEDNYLKASSGELSEDREDDDEEPEMATENLQNMLESKLNFAEEKKKKNDQKQQECMGIIYSDYAKLEEIKYKLEENMGFDNFFKAYGALKDKIEDFQGLNTIEELYQQQDFYNLLPFLDKKVLDDNIAKLITLIIMEENWERNNM